MKYLNIIIALCFWNLIFSQSKGVTPIVNGLESTVNRNTYAVVVGISDYQDPAIPDLRFADKDAEVFANFLRSEAGGKLDKDHLKVLLNSQATMGQIAIALDWLMEKAVENDRVYIYFSGHGDVEKKTLTQPGFLLCWDAPSQIYMSGGAFALPMLQEVISTLSIQNKAKVYVITDACRSGKLSGSSINGNQLTNTNLARQYANELKILSCQPDEESIEGAQWGEGRGVFSYVLVNGLYGMADLNNDQQVSSFELSRYLEDNVSKEVQPFKQVPMVIGKKSDILAKVNPKLLAAIKIKANKPFPVFSIQEDSSLEEVVLGNVEKSVFADYSHFKNCLRNKIFMEPEKDCAEFYYQRLIQQSSINPLLSNMRRNYAAALQDDAQQVMNKWFNSDQNELSLSKKSKEEKYKLYPKYLQKSAELLGKDHYMFNDLQARKLFFEGYLMILDNMTPRPEEGYAALKKFHEALTYQPEFTQAYWQISLIYGYHILNADSLEYYTQKAIEQAPTWVSPYDWITYFLSERFGLYDKAKYYLDEGLKLDSNNLGLISNLAIYYQNKGKLIEAAQQYQKLIKLDSIHAPYINLANLYYYSGLKDQALEILKKSYAIDSTREQVVSTLALLLLESEEYTEAERLLKKAITLAPLYEGNYISLGRLYKKVGQDSLKKIQYNKVIALLSKYNDPFQMYALGEAYIGLNLKNLLEQLINDGLIKWPQDPKVEYFIACLYSISNEDKKALSWLEKSLQKGFSDYPWILYDFEWKRFQNNPEYKKLINRHIPINLEK